MKKTQKTSAIILVLLLAATVYGLLRTAEVPKLAPSGGKNPRTAVNAFLVDHTPLKSAQRLARAVTSDEEIPLAKNALKLADYEVDLAYEAVRSDFKRHPPALSAQAREIKDRLEKVQKLVADDEAQIAALKESVSKTTQPAKKETLQGRLDDVEADRDLAEDEVNT